MHTTRDTVRLVKRLFGQGGATLLTDQRQGPNTPHNKIENTMEELIRKEYKEGAIKTLTCFRTFFNRKYQKEYSLKVFRRVTKDLRACKDTLQETKEESLLEREVRCFL